MLGAAHHDAIELVRHRPPTAPRNGSADVAHTSGTLWWLADDPLLPQPAREAVAAPDNEVLVSAATAWEIAITKAAGRLEALDDLLGVIEANDFEMLPITPAHALAAGGLPFHHSDPFDRMLIAQARTETLTLVSVDGRFPHYDVGLLQLIQIEKLPPPRARTQAEAASHRSEL